MPLSKAMLTLKALTRMATPPVGAKQTGAVGDGIANDTRAIQDAIDRKSASGGGKVILPAGTYNVTQLFMRNLVHLEGEGWHSFGGPKTGTVIKQIPGTDLDLIRFAAQPPEYAAGNWVGPFGISGLTLLGHPSNKKGHGIAFLDAAGLRIKMQDLSTLEKICIRGFAGSGIYFEGGSPIIITNVSTVFNGGHGLHIKNPDPAGGYSMEVQSVSVVNFSGDGNSGGAVIRVENMSADYAHNYVGIKSEMRINSDRDKLIAQPNVFQFHNCAHDVGLIGVQHICSGAEATKTTRPGDIILITGKNRPRIGWCPRPKARTLLTQVNGPETMLIRDMTNGKTVPLAGPVVGSYEG